MNNEIKISDSSGDMSAIKSDNFFHSIWENSFDAMRLMDENYTVLKVNPAFAKMFLKSAEKIEGESFLSLIDPQHFPDENNLKAEFESGQIITSQESEIYLWNGNRIWVEASNSFLKTSTDKTLLFTIFREITEKKRSILAMRESEKRFRSVFENAPIGIGISIKDIVIMANPAALRLFDLDTPSEILGDSVLRMVAESSRSLVLKKLQVRATGSIKINDSYEIIGKRKDGVEFPLHIDSSVFDLPEGNAIIFFITDITEQKKYEHEMENSIKEKEILLKEIHHRVKNNLQIISSLLNLQSEYIKDKASLDLFNDSRDRIKSMALIHERLYQSPNLSKVNFSDYVSDLITYLFRAYAVGSEEIKYYQSIEEITLTLDTAIPLGLIINEIVSNSLKYAFFESRVQKSISLSIICNEDRIYTLKISDNGRGIPASIDFRNTDSLGLQLVCSLVSQLNGTIELDRSMGTEFTITFSV